ncbi:MAG: pyrimidine-nucleoside phosphorylase, partial [Dethiobacteria bacterium]
MRTYDLIIKKRNGFILTKAEIDFLISGYVDGSIPDYQMSALAMAIYFQGMNEEETLHLTMAMVNSGDTISLKKIPGIKVDKHSTGGVGDTTTLVLAPLVAAAGVPVAKLSGRGLGHTGGTLDKLESIPGFSTEMTVKELLAAVKNIGVAVAGQTGNLVPADKMLYALRDVTATVDSMPLIAGSIMSKKLAAGADALVLDVKSGDGAFLKDREQAFKLARAMVNIGNGAGRETVAVVTNMDQPLGRAVGNALEVEEAILTLRGEGPPDLEELCLVLGGWVLCLAGKTDSPVEGKEILKKLIDNGEALRKMKELISNQHGNDAVTENLHLLPHTTNRVKVKAVASGYIKRLKAEAIGVAAMTLGAGREKKDSIIDLSPDCKTLVLF